MTKKDLTLNATLSGAPATVRVAQYDHEARTVRVKLTDVNGALSLPSGTTAKVEGTKPSGKGFSYSCTLTGNEVTVIIKDQMTAEPGRVSCEVVLFNGTKRLGAGKFELEVDPAGLQVGTITSSDTFDSIIRDEVRKCANEQLIVLTVDTELNSESPNPVANSTLCNFFANALKGYASGALITANDVSPIAHNPKVRVHGKNIFDPKMMETKYDYDGLAITRNGDEITINGTAKTTHSRPVIDILQPINKGKTYTCTIFRVSGSGDRLVVSYGLGTQKGIREEFYDCTSVAGNASDYRVFTANYKYLTRFLMYFQEGATFNNLVIKIQLEESPATTAYEPWVDPTGFTVTDGKGNTFTPDTDGTVEGVTSTSPTMTLSLDKEGAVIECEYNRDLTAAVERIEAALFN